ncbi:hypothetical protein PYCCODRAFT_207830 [Trametes coccinea BRFM310]|uniref:Uncharacterized protein n=1 Tax=Trametes coccinea (strain BRFM310) TaxID=1353009 RepID=A0A1Y2ITA5_TRAC3|nr:hypothetical protein PYCCODRAFT_207830 [Trametes coccinea BRFM310]
MVADVSYYYLYSSKPPWRQTMASRTEISSRGHRPYPVMYREGYNNLVRPLPITFAALRASCWSDWQGMEQCLTFIAILCCTTQQVQKHCDDESRTPASGNAGDRVRAAYHQRRYSVTARPIRYPTKPRYPSTLLLSPGFGPRSIVFCTTRCNCEEVPHFMMRDHSAHSQHAQLRTV